MSHCCEKTRALTPLLLLLVLAAGCTRQEPAGKDQQSPQAKAARSDVERGPLRLSAWVEPSPARLSDEPKLTIEMVYPPGVTVQKPDIGSALGEFVVRDYRTPLPEVQGDKQVLRQTLTLEPHGAGKVVIEPIVVAFSDQRKGDKPQEHVLETDPITVEVLAAVAGEAPSLAQLRGEAPPVVLPGQSRTWLWLSVGAALALLTAAIVWCRRRRLAQQAALIQLTPAEMAYLELQQLMENEAARDDVRVFYVELTAIVRRYIERTTGIRAPEQTTQEFLHEVSRRSDFPAEEAQRLLAFLEAADLVKFAAHQPRKEDVEESFRRAKAFVGCAEREEVVA